LTAPHSPAGRSRAETADPRSDAEAPTIPTPSRRFRELVCTDAGLAVLGLIPRYFHARLEGAEHLPREGGALIVSNHALFALDSAVFGTLLVREIGRFPRFLADRNLWKVPALRELITAIGALPGDPEAAVTLLRRGEIVIVYPGGVDDSLKLSAERYRLKWKTRAGFARVAMAARVPIIPVVGAGIDEMYSVRAREHWIGRRVFGSARYDLPIALGAFGSLIPHRARQTFTVLPPIPAEGDPGSPEDIERVRAVVYDALESHLRELRNERTPR
jgi:1-acyl-sn-glycerol-3-phosphate acyltransferase